jgi:hypothetical protein
LFFNKNIKEEKLNKSIVIKLNNTDSNDSVNQKLIYECFIIKNDINKMTKSNFVEQKSYEKY